MRSSPLRVAVLVGANLLGLLAFVWPFVLPLGGRSAHEADAPVILVGLLVLLGAVLFVELGRGGMGPKAVALIGVLGAAMVALRLPGFGRREGLPGQRARRTSVGRGQQQR